ncbi:hypothetical protein LIER_24088 [Lithospermum erythrorhizon]|uniref:Uncharacterized protein n=1 Tax=Lithospermum erythrorhizon TaxID=34254 RepID=A0AAV3R3X5_LITER
MASAVNPPFVAGTGAAPSGPAETMSDDILRAAENCVEPRDVPFSAMAGDRRPLFRKVKVKKVSVPSGAGHKEVPVATHAPATTSASHAGKRPSPDDERPRVFGARKKHAARRPKRIETVEGLGERLPQQITRGLSEERRPQKRKRAGEGSASVDAAGEEGGPGAVHPDGRADANPPIVDNYKDFMKGYNADSFTSCNLDALLTPDEEDDEEAALPEDDSAV